MDIKYLKLSSAATALVLSISVNAALIPGGHLLDQAGASQLEGWLGLGEQDWTSIWYGTGSATAQSWHAAVDGVGATVTLFDITYKGVDYIVGGYTDLDWTATNTYVQGARNSFIFNLDLSLKQDPTSTGEIFARDTYFATFGIGHDLKAAYTIDYQDHWAAPGCGNYGTVSILDGITTGCYTDNFTLHALETYTVPDAVPHVPVPSAVPVPATVWLFGSGLIGLIGLARRKTDA